MAVNLGGLLTGGGGLLQGLIPAIIGYKRGKLEKRNWQEQMAQRNAANELRKLQLDTQKAYQEGLLEQRKADAATREEMARLRATPDPRGLLTFLASPYGQGLLEANPDLREPFFGMVREAFGARGMPTTFGAAPMQPAAPPPSNIPQVGQLEAPDVLPPLGVGLGMPPPPVERDTIEVIGKRPPPAAPAAPAFKLPRSVTARIAETEATTAKLTGQEKRDVEAHPLKLRGLQVRNVLGEETVKDKRTFRKPKERLMGAQAGALESVPGYREKQIATTRRGQDIGAATTRRGQDIGAQTAAANRANQRELGFARLKSEEGRAAARLAAQKTGAKVSPLRKKAWDNAYTIATKMVTEKNPVSGMVTGYKPAYPDAERRNALNSLIQMAGEENIPLSSLGLGLSDDATPAASGGAGLTRVTNYEAAKMNYVSDLMRRGKLNSILDQLDPEQQLEMAQYRDEVLRRRKGKGK